jgi:hypothetical protein
MAENKPFVIRAMTKAQLQLAYGISQDVWYTWMNRLPAEIRAQIPATRTVLTPAEVKLLVDHWGDPPEE